MNARQHAVRLVILKAVKSWVDAVMLDAKEEALLDDFVAGDRVTAALPDGTVLGKVTLANGRSSFKVVDERAFKLWMYEHHPDSIIDVVRESDKKAVLKAIEGGGEVPDGVEETSGNPYFIVLPEEAAVAGIDWRPYVQGLSLVDAEPWDPNEVVRAVDDPEALIPPRKGW